MKIATFNINGIKARINALSNWLQQSNPDVVLLQEIKSLDSGFPRTHFEDMGYNVETNGQKSFNGVGILSKYPLEDINRTLPGDPKDEQARWIEATVLNENTIIKVCSLYAPNGNPTPGPKYEYKLNWMERLFKHAGILLQTEMPIILGGDYNVIPQRIDAANPSQWTEDALFLLKSRNAFRKLINLGYIDSYRIIEDAPEHYTFWDYQAGSWNRNNGIRIDHLLLNANCADYLEEAGIDSEIRGYEKPSDHVPIWIKLRTQQ
ncbi:MAG: exodeoxyribonuclease III [Paracoccaceae bacterium]